MVKTQIIRGTKYAWRIPEINHELVLKIAVKYSLSIPLAKALVARGYTDFDQIDAYLFSTYENNVVSASSMKDAQKAVDRILLAINNKEKILIFGDYDVDGITSSALMMTCLQPLGAQVNFYLPNRVKDGYGLSTKVVKRAAENNYKVIITVDNGTTAFEPALVAKELGIDLIITDHHKPHDKVPDSFALVNPHQKECQYPFKEFAGVGVTFKVLSLLYETLQKTMPEKCMPDKAYELLLLGTVADVVPLQGENRFWVRYGLQWLNNKSSMSLDVLKMHGKVTTPLLKSTDIGFKIAPQINALGRLEDPRQGVQFLLGTDQKETEFIGNILFQLNQARKEIERSIFEDVQRLIENGTIDLTKENIIMAASNNWPAGVIGLVASRLVNEYTRPVLLFHLTKDGKAKGSCRSLAAFNMFEALQQNKHLLDQFGGHAVAAGLALDVAHMPALKESLEKLTREQLTPDDFINSLTIDADISMTDITKKLTQDMGYLEPFGAANSEPIFCVHNVSLVQKPQLLKDLHVKCSIFADGVIKPLVFFNRPDLFNLLNEQGEEPFSVAVQITENHWQGRISVELLGRDVAGLKA